MAAFGAAAEARGASPPPPGVRAFAVERVSEQSVRLNAQLCSDGPGHAVVKLEKQNGERWEVLPETFANTSSHFNYLVNDLLSGKKYTFRVSVQLPRVSTTPLPYTSTSTSTESFINVRTEDTVTPTSFVTTLEDVESTTSSVLVEDNSIEIESENYEEKSNCSEHFPHEKELEITTCTGLPPPASEVVGKNDSVCWRVPSHDCVLGKLVFHVVLRLDPKNRQSETQFKKIIHRNCPEQDKCCLKLPSDVISQAAGQVSATVMVAWEDSKEDIPLTKVEWVRVSSGLAGRSLGGLVWLLPLCVLLIGLPLNYYLMRLRWKRRNNQPLRGEPWRPPQLPSPLPPLPHLPPSPSTPVSPTATSPLCGWELDNEGYLVSAAVLDFPEETSQPTWKSTRSDCPPPIPPLPNRSGESWLPPGAVRLPSTPPRPPPRNAPIIPPPPPPRPPRNPMQPPSS